MPDVRVEYQASLCQDMDKDGVWMFCLATRREFSMLSYEIDVDVITQADSSTTCTIKGLRASNSLMHRIGPARATIPMRLPYNGVHTISVSGRTGELSIVVTMVNGTMHSYTCSGTSLIEFTGLGESLGS